MADETKQPETPPETPERGDEPRSGGSSPRSDDKSPSAGPVGPEAGSLPPPPEGTDAPRPTPDALAAQTGKAPSGSSSSGTTVPAASSETSAPVAETPEERKARLIAEAQARKASATASAGPPGGESPSVGDPAKSPSQADAEKAARIAEAKARVAAAKQAAGDKPSPAQPGAAAAGGPAPGAPKAPVKKKEEGPKPTDAAGHPLVKRLRERLGGALLEASEFIGQLSIRIEAARIVEACDALKRDPKTPFDYLSDLTCVHFPERVDAPFEIVYNLYSIPGNERVRLKVAIGDGEQAQSVTSVWPTANWMEREVYDLFGVVFANHPDLRRILLPEDWEGHPLRKEYPLEFMENDWTAKHLPEFSGVQKEQLEQRRNYGLEALSTEEERRVREIFRAGKEVMPKDK
ncbi:MAG TPA: NADH-quinone oxidoreductase subunit C [Pyrinomonadaceae bacterium]|jgi:NADH-quinone oxidoreductase subunit C|nr:NADH-quinone oxidoreductase subunit C [Pyrinomonadaceae bacterium]